MDKLTVKMIGGVDDMGVRTPDGKMNAVYNITINGVDVSCQKGTSLITLEVEPDSWEIIDGQELRVNQNE